MTIKVMQNTTQHNQEIKLNTLHVKYALKSSY